MRAHTDPPQFVPPCGQAFGAWLQAQSHRDDPVGDLARDMSADPAGPATDDVVTVLDYVATVGGTNASAACRSALAEWRGGAS